MRQRDIDNVAQSRSGLAAERSLCNVKFNVAIEVISGNDQAARVKAAIAIATPLTDGEHGRAFRLRKALTSRPKRNARLRHLRKPPPGPKAHALIAPTAAPPVDIARLG